MTGLPPFAWTKVSQVGLVVRDIDAMMRTYHEKFGVGPWVCYTYGPPLVKEMTYRGKRQDYRMRIALGYVGETMIELIQPLEGPTIYEEHLAQHGEGIHHLLQYLDDLDGAIRDLEARGYRMIQSGRGYGVDGDGGYAYFDTVADLGLILEVAQVPRRRVPPEKVYPAPA